MKPSENFKTEEVLLVKANCWINGKLYQAGDKTPPVKGNDKAQLLASQKCEKAKQEDSKSAKK